MRLTKIFSLALLIFILSLSLFSCAAGHEHTYSSEWTVTESEHYKAPLCVCNAEPKDKGEHIDEDNNGVCDECEYDFGHTHTYGEEWIITTSEHYKKASCGHDIPYINKSSHKDTDNNGLCDTCSYDYGHTHTYSVSWTVTTTEHYKAPSCSHDVAPIDKGAHVDANNDGVCDTCSYDYGHTHTYSDEWTVTDTEHYKNATCGHNACTDKGAHTDSENDGVCDVCSYGSDHLHTYSNEWTKTDTEHYKAATCGHDVSPINREAHIDENNDRECDICGYDYNHTHTYSDTLSYDELGNHFYAPNCECNIPNKSVEAHTDDDGDCECDECHAVLHKLSREWTKTADGHYKAYDCGNPLHIIEAGEHTDGDDDCLCDTCLYVMHTYSDEWTITDKEHYHEASCGKDEHAIDVGKHEYTGNDRKCDECGKKSYNLPSVDW